VVGTPSKRIEGHLSSSNRHRRWSRCIGVSSGNAGRASAGVRLVDIHHRNIGIGRLVGIARGFALDLAAGSGSVHVGILLETVRTTDTISTDTIDTIDTVRHQEVAIAVAVLLAAIAGGGDRVRVVGIGSG